MLCMWDDPLLWFPVRIVRKDTKGGLMNPRMLVGVLAVFCGLGAAYLTLNMNRNKNKGPEMVEVLWSKTKVPLREKISEPEKYFVLKQVPKGSQPPKALLAFEQIKDKRLNKSISEENYVTLDDILAANQQFLEPEKGKRLFGLTVNAESLAGGFIRPGSYVDLIGMKRLPNGNSEAQTFMQNVRVLAVGDKSTLQGDDKHSLVENTVTLEVTPEQSQILTIWKTSGEIKLSARAIGDNEEVNTKTVKLNPDEIKATVPMPEVGKKEPEVAKPKTTLLQKQTHTLVILDMKDPKGGSSSAETVEFYQDEKGKWHTRFRQDRGRPTASVEAETNAPATEETLKNNSTPGDQKDN